MTLPINQYGHVDVRMGTPMGLVYISALHMTVTCKRIGVECAPAFVGTFCEGKARGVVIHAADEHKVRAAMRERDARRPDRETKHRRQLAKQERETKAFEEKLIKRFPSMGIVDVIRCAAHTTVIGSRRAGRSKVCTDPALAAVVSFIRHERTDYDLLLRTGYDRDGAREEVNEQIRQQLATWQAPKEEPGNGTFTDHDPAHAGEPVSAPEADRGARAAVQGPGVHGAGAAVLVPDPAPAAPGSSCFSAQVHA